jgi:hypothetical protein
MHTYAAQNPLVGERGWIGRKQTLAITSATGLPSDRLKTLSNACFMVKTGFEAKIDITFRQQGPCGVAYLQRVVPISFLVAPLQAKLIRDYPAVSGTSQRPCQPCVFCQPCDKAESTVCASTRRWRQTLRGDNPESPPSSSTLQLEKESAKSKRHTGSSWQGWCIYVFCFTAQATHLGCCRVTRQAGRGNTKGYLATVESISRKIAVADPRAGESVAQLAQGREKSIGQIGTMMMLESQLLSW